MPMPMPENIRSRNAEKFLLNPSSRTAAFTVPVYLIELALTSPVFSLTRLTSTV